jgi:hypothetical protein
VLKIYNLLSQETLSFGQEAIAAEPSASAVPTPAGTTPWEVNVQGKALIPAHSACHRGEVVGDHVYEFAFKFTQNDVSKFANFTKMDADKPFYIHSKDIGLAPDLFSLSVSKPKEAQSTFRLLSVDVKIKDV